MVEGYIIYEMKKINFKQCLRYSREGVWRLVWNGKKTEEMKIDGKCDELPIHEVHWPGQAHFRGIFKQQQKMSCGRDLKEKEMFCS